MPVDSLLSYATNIDSTNGCIDYRRTFDLWDMEETDCGTTASRRLSGTILSCLRNRTSFSPITGGTLLRNNRVVVNG